ncbi:MAG: tetratricopeptide repeat protein [Acidobacteria bacterium]|nr:tetratricopeptide repeat protein [Acidobacteriota bacterium]
MDGYPILLVALIALLLGLAGGKAWERYKLREGRWIDRRKVRESPHYILGLNFLVANQIDQAIEELTEVASLDPAALEIHMILGNLYREKGQVGRAVQIHQSLLQRPKLTKLEHAYVLLCLGLDFKTGGFVDRALEAFNEVLRLDPHNQHAHLNLEKLHEEQHQWGEAYRIRHELARLPDRGQPARDRAILAFLENELGLQALKRMDHAEATRRFEAAIELDSTTVPAHLNLGDVRFDAGDAARAIESWEQILASAPDRAYLAFERLASAYASLGRSDQFAALCRRLIAGTPQDWRARLALARHLAATGCPSEALDLLFDALVQNPHALVLHQTIWRTLSQLNLPTSLVDRYIDLTRTAVFYLDPHICTRCRYRSTELLWQCPHCHEWNTFVEERIAPAKDGETA